MYVHVNIKRGPERFASFVDMFTITVVVFGLFLDVNAVPLNVVNMEGIGLLDLEGVPKMRADYGFYAADNQSAFKGDSYLDIIAANSDSHLMKARSSNALQRSGCRYKATMYSPGDNVPTDESCLFCHCKGSVVVCKLRVCPEVPNPPPPGCIIVQKANKCCSQLVCHDNQLRKLAREQRLSSEANTTETLPSSALQNLEQGNSCLHEGTLYAEGSAMRSSTLCEHCFCIHGKMKCSSPQCLIPLNGCKPRYRSYACCPTNYDCNQSNQTAILKTTPASTKVPQFLKGCTVGGRYVAEGDPILPMQLLAAEHNSSSNSLGPGPGIGRCQTCFCMGGVVHCRPLACDRPIDGCRPIIEDGHCCPDRYECDQSENGDPTTTTSGVNDDTETETTVAPSTTPFPDVSSSTQIYEVRFEKVPLFTTGRKEDDEEEEEAWIAAKTAANTAAAKKNKQSRISYTSLGGFKNGGITGFGIKDARGSREQRRKNKERSEFLPRSFYDDDAREDSSLSFESSSGRSDERSSQVIEEKSEASTSTEELPTPETDPSVVLVTELSEIVTDKTELSIIGDGGKESSTSKIVTDSEVVTTEASTTQLNLDTEDDEADDILPLTLTNDLKLEPIPALKIATTTPGTTEVANASSTSSAPEFSSSSNPTPTPTPNPTSSSTFATTSFKATTTMASTSTSTLTPSQTPPSSNGKVEFISFGMEDAVFSPINETRYEIYPGHGASLPKTPNPTYNLVARQGSLIPATDSQQYFHEPKSTPKPETTTPTLAPTTNSRPIVIDEPPLAPLRLQQAPLEELESISISETGPPSVTPVEGHSLPQNPIEPIVFVQDELRNSIMDVPVQTSLYNNGYYGQGSIVDEHAGKDIELIITQAELGNGSATEENDSIISTTTSPPPPVTTTKTVKIKPSLQPISVSNKRPEQPLTAISSNQKFIPSFLPITSSSSIDNDNRNPSRTYSKFGIQDSSHRYGYNPGGGGQDEVFHESIFSPSHHSMIPQPFLTPGLGSGGHHHTTYPPNLMDRKVPHFPDDPMNQLRYIASKNNNNSPFLSHGGGNVKPTLALYDEGVHIDEEDEEDEENSDNGSEDEFASYESYLSPNPSSPPGHGDVRPMSPIVGSPSNNPPSQQSNNGSVSGGTTGPSSFGHRYGMPHSSQPMSGHPGPGGPIPMISISGTKVSMSSSSSKDKVTSGSGSKTKFVNSKPLRRPQPIQQMEEHQLQDSGDPLGFKPVVAFPFAIPKSQDKFNLGLKLSGCNIYGKMHGIGQIIHELSSICVQCKCTEVGVQCSELQC